MRKVVGLTLVLLLGLWLAGQAQAYVGSRANCRICHNNVTWGYKYNTWKNTLHSRIHRNTTPTTVTGDFTQNPRIKDSNLTDSTQVFLYRNGNVYEARIGTPPDTARYTIAYTYGGGWKQRYLVRRDSSYYTLPIQWNSNGYKDNSSGQWIAYNTSTWYNANGSLKPTNTNAFRSKSWDKNCSGCHITGNDVVRRVVGADTAWVSHWAVANSDSENVVGCEMCHGPGDNHNGNRAEIVNPQTDLPYPRSIEVCGQCHFRGASFDGDHEYPWNNARNRAFQPKDTLANFISIAPPNQTGGPGTWPDSITPRQHHQQWQDFNNSRRHLTSWPDSIKNCWKMCHNVHDTTAYEHQLKANPANNAICINSTCHAVYQDTVALKNHTHHSYDPTNANNTLGASRCTKCHAAKTAITAKAYDIHMHSFRVVSPQKTLDYRSVQTPTFGELSSCAVSCHRNPPTGSQVPTFNIPPDTTFTKWGEGTDVTLAETLMAHWRVWWPVGVEERPDYLGGPVVYELAQSYPNPLSDRATIAFELAKPGRVTLGIYNLTGQLVRSLLNQPFQAGRYTLVWDGLDNRGQRVADGVYFYRIAINGFQKQRKLVVLK